MLKQHKIYTVQQHNAAVYARRGTQTNKKLSQTRDEKTPLFYSRQEKTDERFNILSRITSTTGEKNKTKNKQTHLRGICAGGQEQVLGPIVNTSPLGIAGLFQLGRPVFFPPRLPHNSQRKENQSKAKQSRAKKRRKKILAVSLELYTDKYTAAPKKTMI